MKLDIRQLFIAAGALYLAGCSASPSPPAVVRVAPPPRPTAAAPDWFHRQLALARHAGASHLARGDAAGAQAAYDAVMGPTCARVATSGPAKYRARCAILVARKSTAVTPVVDDLQCSDGHDDSLDTPEQKAACND